MPSEMIAGFYRVLRDWVQGTEAHERARELLGSMLARQIADKNALASLHEAEFRVHSQFGDDGIIQWLVARLPTLPKRFVEFGIEDYTESNTRFLMVNNNWAGLVMDGSTRNINRLRSRNWFWRHDLTALAMFVTRDNVDQTIAKWAGGEDVGLLHVDVDGNDYWLWEAVTSIRPGIVIMEYNGLFGPDRAITVPYAADFRRNAAHVSGQYFGASIAALAHLAAAKGYSLIGSNSAGNNAYFIRNDLLDNSIRATTPALAYVQPRFRDSRGANHHLDFVDFAARQARLAGLPVVDVVTSTEEPF